MKMKEEVKVEKVTLSNVKLAWGVNNMTLTTPTGKKINMKENTDIKKRQRFK